VTSLIVNFNVLIFFYFVNLIVDFFCNNVKFVYTLDFHFYHVTCNFFRSICCVCVLSLFYSLYFFRERINMLKRLGITRCKSCF
jgi:hypothetical protein